jgi:hypothetical protein
VKAKQNLFTIASKNTYKNPKKMKDVYHEYYKTLKKEIEEDTKRWKDLPC